MIVTIILIILGLIVGGFAEEEAFASSMLGGAAGLALGGLWIQRKRWKRLRQDLDAAVAKLDRLSAAKVEAAPPVTALPPAPVVVPAASTVAPPLEAKPAPTAAEPTAAKVEVAPAAPTPVVPAAPVAPAPPPAPVTPVKPPAPGVFDTVAGLLRAYFLGGNTVVRVGVIVLFVGVGLLGKWAADHAYFPPEARLILAAVIGIGLTALGWRLRVKRQGFAMSLQGGGIGIIYMTAFLALRLYEFIPAPLAFAIFVALTFFAGVLAVVQDALALAVLGTVGGFLAPIMASTGEGRHVVLFSFYALLNAGIFGVAWFKAWRLLNWLGFVATFGIAGAWGVLQYQPEKFATTEPFLVLFFLFYVGLSVLYAWRQPPKLAGLIDATLAFGTPIVVFIYQARLVEGEKFGMALSSFAAALVYLGLGLVLLRISPKTMRNLVEAFLALGVAFGTMTIPFAVSDQHVTGAVWSLEGAGLVWFGLRQQRWLSRATGVVLQLAAAIAFAASDGVTEPTPFLNGRFLGALMLTAAAWIIAALTHRYRRREGAWGVGAFEQWVGHALLFWGLCWWFGAGFAEIDDLVKHTYEATAFLGLFVFTATGFELVGRALQWPAGRLVALLYLPVAYVFVPAMIDLAEHPFGHLGFVPWLLGFVVYYLVLYRHDDDIEAGTWQHKALAVAHVFTLWLVGLLGMIEVGRAVDRFVDNHAPWPVLAVTLVPVALVMLVAFWQDRFTDLWPVGPRRLSYVLVGAGGLSAFLLLLAFIGNMASPGDADPLPYLPIANPTDLAQAAAFLGVLGWYGAARCMPHSAVNRTTRLCFIWIISIDIFIGITAILVRSVHQWTDVPFHSPALFKSAVLQSGISILWTVMALTAMVVATRKRWRVLWIVSAVVLGVVVVKLFLVDLSTLSTVARIVSFLVVGGLLLLVGYLSPIPPAKQGAAAAAKPTADKVQESKNP
jgi:uncharacterized membrane protein